MTKPSEQAPTQSVTTTPNQPPGILSCEDLYDEIRSNIEDANYCEIDSDCKTLVLGGTYIDFGCYHFINDEIDESFFYDKMRDYAMQCVEIINECAPAPDAKCVSNKCVYVE